MEQINEERLKAVLDSLFSVKTNAELLDKHPEPTVLRDAIADAFRPARMLVDDLHELLRKKAEKLNIEPKDL